MKVQAGNISTMSMLRIKAGDYAALTKFRLSLLVVVSAVFGYILAANGALSWSAIAILSVGGFLVTGASNALNQVFERDFDRLMKRTENRPLPAGRMTSIEASIAAGLMGIAGILLLTLYFNMLAGMLSALSLISYAFIYTPMKRISPIATFVGAIPGALPPLIGYVAYSGEVSLGAALIFFLQFIWQFPHFWAIAWVSFDDYKRAGYMLLPSKEGKTRFTALLSMIYTISLIPIACLPYYYGIIGLGGTVVCVLAGVLFSYLSWVFYRKCDDASARKLMFGSFLYLPVIQLALVLDKI